MRSWIRRPLGAALVAAAVAVAAAGGIVVVAPDGPSPTPTATATATATPGGCLASAGCFPKPQGSVLAGVTGIPPGTVMTSCGGNVTISTSGSTVTNCTYTGRVTVTGNNVTIRKSRIPAGITTTASGLVIEDSDLGPNTCGEFGDIVAVVKWAGYSVYRSYIHGNGDGLRFAGANIRAEDNFIQTCRDPGDPDPHMDGVQGNFSGQSNYVVHNTIDTRPDGNNANVFFADDSESCVCTDNLLVAKPDGFTLKINDDHTPDVGPWVITGNRLSPGTKSTTNTECAGVRMTWTDNRVVTVNSDYTIASTGSLVSC